MFTGIVTDVGTVLSAEESGDLRLRIGCGFDPDSLELGASVACSGVCLTVVDKGRDGDRGWFAVDVSAETRSRTASGLWSPGSRLNLERSLRLGEEMGGHIVTGHVDAVATVVAASDEGGSRRVTVEAPVALAPLIAEKGSIALDGVSLTVNTVEDERPEGIRFTVNIIPHTALQTTLDRIEPGRQLNVEADVLARYLQRLAAAR